MATHFRWLNPVGVLLAALGPWTAARAADRPAPDSRPNILFCLADDWSWPHAGAFGDKVVKTPNFDRIAAGGVLFTHAFAAAPSCTPSRATILTGQWAHRLGPGADQSGILPGEHRVYPDVLEEVGYSVGYMRKGWAPGTLRGSGRRRNPAGQRFPDFARFLEQVPQGRPFCFWFGSLDPHRPYKPDTGSKLGVDSKDVEVPLHLPDTSTVRKDLLDYYYEVERFDREVGGLLDLLRKKDKLHNTIVVVTGDQGMPFPRCKTNVYDSGLRVPLAICWPAKVPGGRRIDDFVSLTDLAPTFLEAAGVAPWPQITGRSLLPMLLSDKQGRVDPARDKIFLERERHADCRAEHQSYPVRAVRTSDYLYVRNLRPELLPAGDPAYVTISGPYADMDRSPVKTELMEGRSAPKLVPFFKRACEARPAEELYEVAKDPSQIHNVAGLPEYGEVQQRLRAELDRWMAASGDPRARGETDVFDKAPYVGAQPRREEGPPKPAVSPGAARGAPAAAQRPNIVLIMADDMGFADIGCYGGEIPTPNIDRLAAAGLRFTQFYNTSRCAPTRASLLTGLYAHRTGVGYGTPDWGLPGYRGRLNDHCATIAECLQAVGYRSFITGKWHVGIDPEYWPLGRGFDRFYGSPHGGGHHFRMLRGRPLVFDDRVVQPGPGWFSTTAVTDYTVRFIDESVEKGKPFFGYVAYFAPHYPMQALPQDIRKYAGRYDEGWEPLRAARYRRQLELGIIPKQWALSPPDPDIPPWSAVKDKKESSLRMTVYAAMVDEIDQGVGRIVETLRRNKVLDDTLILFLSDNGACPTGGPLGEAGFQHRGSPQAVTGTADSYVTYGSAWANAGNTPFRRYKADVYEGGITTPLIVHWPARIKDRGALRNQISHVIDLLPTCLDAAGARYPEAYRGKPIIPADGRSLVPAFDDQPVGHDVLYFEHMGNRAVRQGRWKIVGPLGRPWELYDMEADRTEIHDLADSQPARVARMAEMYDRWARQCGVEPWSELPGGHVRR